MESDEQSRVSEGDPEAVSQNDPVLHPFLGSTHETQSEEFLARLICTNADPVIHAIIGRKLCVSLRPSDGRMQNQDAIELLSSVRAVLISELRNLKQSQNERFIGNFGQYVAVKSFSACADYFRKKHPHRSHLKSSLRYHLKHNPRFAIWEGETGESVCGLTEWAPTADRAASINHLPKTLDISASVLFPEGPVALGQLSPPDLLETIFRRAGKEIELDQLVVIAAEVWSVKDHPTESYQDERLASEGLMDLRPGVDTTIEQRAHLSMLWKEVCDLPILQRSALLLNLREQDGGGVIAFLPYLGVASKDEIAELVGLPYELFAKLWNELPLEDSKIAQLLGITRQQVINLRKTARERLMRRMRFQR